MFGMGTLGHQRWGFQHSCRSCRRIEGTEVDASLFLFFQYNRTVWMGLVWVFWWFLDRRAKQRLHRVLLRHLQETSLPAVQVIHLGLQLRFRKHFFLCGDFDSDFFLVLGPAHWTWKGSFTLWFEVESQQPENDKEELPMPGPSLVEALETTTHFFLFFNIR